MAVIQSAVTPVEGGIVLVTWANMANGDTGTPFFAPNHLFKEVQVKGTFGVGGNVQIQGTLDSGTTYAALNDLQGNALDFAAAKIERVQESVAEIRPSVTAGDGATSLTVIIAMREEVPV